MSTSNSALNFDSSLPRTYSDSWREAYGQSEDSHRLSSYQAPSGEPVIFAYDSISLGGGQNVDTAEYPYGFWSNTQLGEKAQTIKVKGHVIGEKYIAERNKLVTAFQVATDDDNPGTLDLPLWGRFKVVVTNWNVDEERAKTGLSDISIELVRAGYSDTKRFEAVSSNLTALNVESAVADLKSAAVSSFAVAVEKSKDTATLASGFGKITKTLASIVGRVQGAISKLNDMTNKINAITSLIAQGVRAPKELAQAVVSAAFGIVAGIMEIKNAADETASYFMRDSDSDSDSSGSASNSSSSGSSGSGNSTSSSGSSGNGSSTSPSGSSTSSSRSSSSAGTSNIASEIVEEQFIKRNEKNVLMNFLTATNYELDDEAITEQQYNTKSAVENLYKVVAFGAVSQLLTKLDSTTQTYESQKGLWALFEKLEDSIDKEDSDIYAAVENCRIACAQTLLSYNYDMELTRHIKREMPLLTLALYLGCDADRIRSLNAVSDSFLIKGDVIYV
ncbi:MAG: DNA circularization N-terminal domain-containing protein [Treponema sp.]|nr:DNA circularization N-terminal domain-containing protein [Treponema sp.]